MGVFSVVAKKVADGREARKALAAVASTAVVSQDAEAGFFSQAVKASQALQRKSGNAQSFWNDLTGKGQVKPDELNAMGFKEHFGNRNDISKEEVQQFINDNQISIDEVRLGQKQLEEKDKYYVRQIRNDIYGIYQPDGTLMEGRSNLEDAQEMVDFYNEPPNDTSQYGKYTLDGGESGDNYRELLMRLSIDPKTKREIKALHEEALKINAKQKPLYDELQALLKKEMDNNGNFANPDAEKRVLEIESERDEIRLKERLLQTQIHEKMNASGYNSGHFDEDNILTHLRMKDRVDVDGNKTLMLEEVQSDWHQQGKEVGYANPKKLDEINQKIEQVDQEILDTLNSAKPYTSQGKDAPQDIIDKHTRLRNMREKLLFERNQFDDAVPNAPFKGDDKSSWYNLAMKRGLIEAAEGDYDKLAFTTGRQQADRYNLSNYISSLKLREEVVPNDRASGGDPLGERKLYLLDGYNLEGDRVINRRISNPEKELPNIVGKEVAQKLLDQEAKKIYPQVPSSTAREKILNNVDLAVGGEGMKQFYDRTLPNTLNKLVKQDGVKVGKTELPRPTFEEDNQLLGELGLGQARQSDTVHSIDITPEMRERVKKGLPLFTTAVGVPTVGALFSPDVRAESEARKNMTRRERRANPPSEALRNYATGRFNRSLGEIGIGVAQGAAETLDFMQPLNMAAHLMGLPQVVTPNQDAIAPLTDMKLLEDEEARNNARLIGSLFSPI